MILFDSLERRIILFRVNVDCAARLKLNFLITCSICLLVKSVKRSKSRLQGRCFKVEEVAEPRFIARRVNRGTTRKIKNFVSTRRARLHIHTLYVYAVSEFEYFTSTERQKSNTFSNIGYSLIKIEI